MAVTKLKENHLLKHKGGDDWWLGCRGKSIYLRIRGDEDSYDLLNFCPRCGVKLEPIA